MQMSHPEHFHQPVAQDSKSAGSGATLTLISLAHGINHAQAALKPLVFPLVLRELNFGYTELGIMLGVASAVGGSLQLVAGALGRILPRHHVLGIGNAAVGVCFVLVGLAQNYFQFFFWTVMSRVGGAAQHPVGASLDLPPFQQEEAPGRCLRQSFYRRQHRYRIHSLVRGNHDRPVGLASDYDPLRRPGHSRRLNEIVVEHEHGAAVHSRH